MLGLGRLFRRAVPICQKGWLFPRGGRYFLSNDWTAKHRRPNQYSMPKDPPRTYSGLSLQTTLDRGAPAQPPAVTFLHSWEGLPHLQRATLQSHLVGRGHKAARLRTQPHVGSRLSQRLFLWRQTGEVRRSFLAATGLDTYLGTHLIRAKDRNHTLSLGRAVAMVRWRARLQR